MVSPAPHHRARYNHRHDGIHHRRQGQNQQHASEPCDTRLFSTENSDGDDSSSSSSNFDMEELQQRIDQVEDKDSKLNIVVLDTMLPRQVLEIDTNIIRGSWR